MQQGRRSAPAALSFVAQSLTARGLEVEARLQLGQVDVHVLDLEAAVLAAQRERVGEAVLQAEAIGRVGAAVVAGAGQAGDRGDQVPAQEAGLGVAGELVGERQRRSEEHTSELQSLMRISYAVFGWQNKQNTY